MSKTGAFSFDVISRILENLDENGPMKKTRLATAAGLNFNVCKRYLDLLEPIGWIILDPEPRITETGKQIREVLSNPKVTLTNRTFKRRTRPKGSLPVERRRPVEAVPAGTIMVVDDEQDVALTYESFLRQRGYNAKSYLDPYSALKAFADNPNSFDLVVLDIRMPDMNGLQLCQSLRVMNERCKFLFVSALDAAAELSSMLPGIEQSQIIRKPVELERFISAVKGVLEQSY